MEPLQHLVDHDPEALVDRGLLRDSEDARELVLERAGPVERDVGRREREALAAAGKEGLKRRLVALLDQLASSLRRALLVQQVGVERRIAQRAALLGRDRMLQQVVDRRERIGYRLLARSLDQAGELHELEKAGDRPGDVHVGVEPRLAELSTGAPGLLEDLVLDHPVGRLEALGGPEELLAMLLLARVEHGAGVL